MLQPRPALTVGCRRTNRRGRFGGKPGVFDRGLKFSDMRSRRWSYCFVRIAAGRLSLLRHSLSNCFLYNVMNGIVLLFPEYDWSRNTPEITLTNSPNNTIPIAASSATAVLAPSLNGTMSPNPSVVITTLLKYAILLQSLPTLWIPRYLLISFSIKSVSIGFNIIPLFSPLRLGTRDENIGSSYGPRTSVALNNNSASSINAISCASLDIFRLGRICRIISPNKSTFKRIISNLEHNVYL